MFAPEESFIAAIDQTSFRTKGNVVVFGLTKLWTKDCAYTHNFSYSHCRLKGEWMEKGLGGIS